MKGEKAKKAFLPHRAEWPDDGKVSSFPVNKQNIYNKYSKEMQSEGLCFPKSPFSHSCLCNIKK